MARSRPRRERGPRSRRRAPTAGCIGCAPKSTPSPSDRGTILADDPHADRPRRLSRTTAAARDLRPTTADAGWRGDVLDPRGGTGHRRDDGRCGGRRRRTCRMTLEDAGAELLMHRRRWCRRGPRGARSPAGTLAAGRGRTDAAPRCWEAGVVDRLQPCSSTPTVLGTDAVRWHDAGRSRLTAARQGCGARRSGPTSSWRRMFTGLIEAIGTVAAMAADAPAARASRS